MGTDRRGKHAALAKGDPRPIALKAIEAHLTIVFAALTVARCLQETSGITINRLDRTLRPLHSVAIAIGDQFAHELQLPGFPAGTTVDAAPAILEP